MQKWFCRTDHVEAGRGEAVARLWPSRWFESGGLVWRNGSPYHSMTVARFREPGGPFFRPPGCNFWCRWGPQADPFLVPDSGPEIGTAVRHSIVITITGRKTDPILGPDSGTQNGSSF